MRHFLSIVVLALVYSCGSKESVIIPMIEVEAKVVTAHDTLITYGDTTWYKAFDIEISLINKSNQSVSFWLMTCSWYENFIINNDYIELLGWDCDSNYPKVEHLEGKDRLILRASVIKHDLTRYQFITSTRFGLVFIDPTTYKSIDDYEIVIGDKSEQKIIVWSNPLYLNK